MILLKIFEIILSKLSAHDFVHFNCTVYIFIDVEKIYNLLFSVPPLFFKLCQE